MNRILSINKSCGVEPLHTKLYLRKNRYMEKNYPHTVCLDCLDEAWKDTKKYKNRNPKWSGAYSVYIYTCQVCKNEKECTEPRDAGYPTFEYVYKRLRRKKINDILNIISNE